MKKLFRTIVAIVLLSVLFAFAACGGGGDADPVPPAPAPTPTPPAPQPETPAVPTPEVPDEEEVLERLDLTIHYHINHHVFNDEWPAWVQAFEHTNVWLTGTANAVATNAAEEFNLQAAQGFPAHIYGGQHLAAQFMEFGMQGAFLPLNDLIERYAPNFTRIMNENPSVRAFITAPDGNIYHLPTIPDGARTGARTWFIRQDWLDLVGMQIPQTVQELEDVLIAFNEQIPALVGVDNVWPYIDGNWHNVLRLANLWGARAYGHDAHAVRVAPREDTNEIYHTWTDPQFMVALENISRWYGMGLIDESFITRGGGARHELLSQNMAGVFFDFPVSSAAFNDTLGDLIDGFRLVPFAPPQNIFGRRINEHERLPVQPHGWAISHTNPDPARTMQFMDFFYSDLGRTLLSYGAEGISFNFDENGVPYFLDLVFEQDVTPTDFIRFEMGALRFMGYMQIFQYEFDMASEGAREAFRINDSDYFWVRQLPTMSFSTQELDTINRIQPILNDFLSEQIQSMILGDWTQIAGNWDHFVAQAVSLGRDELVAAYQSAFDRTLAMLGQ